MTHSDVATESAQPFPVEEDVSRKGNVNDRHRTNGKQASKILTTPQCCRPRCGRDGCRTRRSRRATAARRPLASSCADTTAAAAATSFVTRTVVCRVVLCVLCCVASCVVLCVSCRVACECCSFVLKRCGTCCRCTDWWLLPPAELEYATVQRLCEPCFSRLSSVEYSRTYDAWGNPEDPVRPL